MAAGVKDELWNVSDIVNLEDWKVAGAAYSRSLISAAIRNQVSAMCSSMIRCAGVIVLCASARQFFAC